MSALAFAPRSGAPPPHTSSIARSTIMAACCGFHRPGKAAINRCAWTDALVSLCRAHTLSATSSNVGMSRTGIFSRFSASRYVAARGPVSAGAVLDESATIGAGRAPCTGDAAAIGGRWVGPGKDAIPATVANPMTTNAAATLSTTTVGVSDSLRCRPEVTRPGGSTCLA